jgi:hypothetical protein
LVEYQNKHDIENGQCTSRHEGNLRNEKIQSYRRADDLLGVNFLVNNVISAEGTNLGNIRGNDCSLGHEIKYVVEPSRQMSATGLGQVESTDGSQLDGETLQKDGEDVAQEHNKQQTELIGCTSSDVGGVVARID